jgi:hypothetical protein
MAVTVEPANGCYLLAGAPGDQSCYRRDDRAAETRAVSGRLASGVLEERWFNVADPDDVYEFAFLRKDYDDELIELAEVSQKGEQ